MRDSSLPPVLFPVRCLFLGYISGPGRGIPNPLSQDAVQYDTCVEMNSRNGTFLRLIEESSLYQRSAVLLAAVELGVFDALAAGPLQADELAARLAASERGMSQLVNALVALGWLELSQGRFSVPPEVAELAGSGGDRSLAAILRHHAHLLRGWADLASRVRSGSVDSPPARSADEHFAFLMAMDDLARHRADLLWETVSLDGVSRLVDVGGGAGRFALEAARRFPGLQAVVVDLPDSEPAFHKVTADTPEASRVSFVAADALEGPLPAGDAALVSSLIHIYGPEELRNLAHNLAAALKPGGRLVIRDFFFADPTHTAPLSTALFAINMLVHTQTGGCYTRAELESLFGPAGFGQWAFRPLDDRMSVLTGVRTHS